MVLDGEVSIVKVSPDGLKTTVLVKLFRGHTFGDTALESKGKVIPFYGLQQFSLFVFSH